MFELGITDLAAAMFVGFIALALWRGWGKGGGTSSDPDSEDYWDTEQFWRDYFDNREQ